MANARHAAGARQLAQQTPGGASLGLRLQRTGRERRFRTADRAADESPHGSARQGDGAKQRQWKREWKRQRQQEKAAMIGAHPAALRDDRADRGGGGGSSISTSAARIGVWAFMRVVTTIFALPAL